MNTEPLPRAGQSAMVLDPYFADTHEVINQPSALADYNLYATDHALRAAVIAHGG